MAIQPQNRPGFRFKNEPDLEPVSLEEAKAFLRVDGASLDAEVGALISAARSFLEMHTDRVFIDREIEYAMSAKEACAGVLLPYGFRSSLLVQSVDSTEVETYSYLTNEYQVTTRRSPVFFKLLADPTEKHPVNPLFTFLSFDPDGYENVRLQYVAGYGPSGADVPGFVRQAVLMMVRFLFDQGGGSTGSSDPGKSGVDIPEHIKTIIAPAAITDISI